MMPTIQRRKNPNSPAWKPMSKSLPKNNNRSNANTSFKQWRVNLWWVGIFQNFMREVMAIFVRFFIIIKYSSCLSIIFYLVICLLAIFTEGNAARFGTQDSHFRRLCHLSRNFLGGRLCSAQHGWLPTHVSSGMHIVLVCFCGIGRVFMSVLSSMLFGLLASCSRTTTSGCRGCTIRQ